LKWRLVFLSLFGFAWISFGFNFILRFLALAYDPILFQATIFPVDLLPDNVLSKTWFYMTIYWVVFCFGFLSIMYILPKPKRVPKVLLRLDLLGSIDKVKLLDLLAIITTLAIIINNLPGIFSVPTGLITPLGYLGSLYVIPATIAWFLYFQSQHIRLRRFIYMFPGFLLYLLSPYREHLITLVMCIIIPAIVIKQKISGRKVIFGIIIFLIGITILTSNYRRYIWEESGYAETSFRNSWEYWNENPGQVPWVTLMNRFHGFDSMALTVDTVPAFFPYSERNVITEFLTQAFLPRAIYYAKSDIKWGREFSTSIWSLDESGRIINRPSAMIAPSMAGDLYSVNGVFMIVLGAFLWGGLVGFLERWIRALGPVASCVLIVLFGLRVAGGIERDFVNASVNFIHMLIILLLLFVIPPFTVKKGHLKR
jgi:hypothetical protein